MGPPPLVGSDTLWLQGSNLLAWEYGPVSTLEILGGNQVEGFAGGGVGVGVEERRNRVFISSRTNNCFGKNVYTPIESQLDRIFQPICLMFQYYKLRPRGVWSDFVDKKYV